jgi:formate/nitrite transporter FocA (FNT family)
MTHRKQARRILFTAAKGDPVTTAVHKHKVQPVQTKMHKKISYFFKTIKLTNYLVCLAIMKEGLNNR